MRLYADIHIKGGNINLARAKELDPSVTEITVTAMDSWVQFFKNIPMGLIAFILIQCSIFTKEYSSGTLVLALTKGLPRVQVVVAKATVLMALWSVGYWLCFGITYAYNAYYWDNSIAQNLLFSTLCWWIFGGFIICLITLFSTCFRSTSGVLLGIGGTVFALYLLGLLPKVSRFVPTALTDGTSLIYGVKKSEDFLPALIITAAIGFFTLFVGASVFNKKRL